MIPITFLTGFYVSEVVRRYWEQYRSLPYPDRLALKLVTYIPGKVKNLQFYQLIKEYHEHSNIFYYHFPG